MARHDGLSFSVPQPCGEDWNRMTPAGAGRHCAACSKVVVDFSDMSDLEILRLLAQPGQICGRFRNSQLDRPLEIAVPARPAAWPGLLVGALLLMGVCAPHHLLAQAPVAPATQLVLPPDGEDTTVPEAEKNDEGGCDDILLSLRVIDSRTLQPIPFFSAKIVEIGLAAKTWIYEGLKISLNRSQLPKEFVLSVSATEYVTSQILLQHSPDQDTLEIEIALELEPIFTMGIPQLPTRKEWRKTPASEKKSFRDRSGRRHPAFDDVIDRQYFRELKKDDPIFAKELKASIKARKNRPFVQREEEE